MKQINMEEGWLEFLRLYVKPLVESIFMGFTSDVRVCLVSSMAGDGWSLL